MSKFIINIMFGIGIILGIGSTIITIVGVLQ